MCASNSHSYTHLIQALGIVRKPTIWVFITSKYPGTHDIGLARVRSSVFAGLDEHAQRIAMIPPCRDVKIQYQGARQGDTRVCVRLVHD